jgi:hypothetical protein
MDYNWKWTQNVFRRDTRIAKLVCEWIHYYRQREGQQGEGGKTNTHVEGTRMAYYMWLILTTVQKEFVAANRLDTKWYAHDTSLCKFKVTQIPCNTRRFTLYYLIQITEHETTTICNFVALLPNIWRYRHRHRSLYVAEDQMFKKWKIHAVNLYFTSVISKVLHTVCFLFKNEFI